MASNFSEKLDNLKTKLSPKLRTFSLKFMDEKTVDQIFPAPAKPQSLMPLLPMIKSDNKSTDSLDQNSQLATQGASYFKMEPDRRRNFEVGFIEEIYMATRRSSPTDEDIMKWLNSLEQGASREGVYRALVLDSVYASLEDFSDPVSRELIDFTQEFYQKYIGVQIY